MVRLLILVTGGNRGFGRGILVAGSWCWEYGGEWTEQDGGLGVFRILWHALRVIHGGGMHHGR